MQESRKLATILFGDITGYTSLMQSNEKEALAKLNQFKKELEKIVPLHQGEIVQYFGDACLLTFDSATHGLDCAMVLQNTLRKADIPVRMGIHLGEVVFTETNVFGDGVNIASRIESIGIPGSILISKSVSDQIQNKSKYLQTSLGVYTFKNVKEPIEVFALANDGLVVPKKKEISGKLVHTKRNILARWAGFGALLILLAGALGYSFWGKEKVADPDSAIREERIAIIPFTNNTIDSSLDILGDLSADWISQGLMDMENTEVVSPYTTKANLESLGILENDPEGRASFAELTGAQNLLTGKYYEIDNEIIFNLEVVNARTGKLGLSFEPIRGKRDQIESLVIDLREQVTGYWASKDMVDSKRIKPPNLEAYQKYLEIIQQNKDHNPLDLIDQDSTFYLARIHLLNINRFAQLGSNLPHFEFFDRHEAYLTSYEKSWVNYLKGLYFCDPQLTFTSLNTLRQKYPKDFWVNHETAAVAYSALNDPELALDIYNQLPLLHIHAAKNGQYYNLRILNTTICLIQLNRITALEPFLNSTRTSEQTNPKFFLKAKVWSAIAQGKDDLAIAALNDYLDNISHNDPILRSDEMFQFYLSNLTSEKFKDEVKIYLLNLINELSSTDPAYPFLEIVAVWLDDQQVKNLVPTDLASQTSYFQSLGLYLTGLIYARNGQMDKVLKIINQLQKYTVPNHSIVCLLASGKSHYYTGVLYAQIGENEMAFKHLKIAQDLGTPRYYFQYGYDRYLDPISNEPEFQQFRLPVQHKN